MKIIKTFETFDFSQTLPLASKADLTLFYHCDSCDALWKEFNQEVDTCKFCKSEEVEELSKEEWYETVGDKLEEDEREELESERLKEEDDFIDLINLDNKYKD
jgi:hypothetical protein